MSEVAEPERVDVDLGDGHRLTWFTYQGAEERHVGAIIWHPDLKNPGETCSSGVVWENAPGDTRPTWQLHGQADAQISLSPSILCLRCGDHGFIRAGRWVKA